MLMTIAIIALAAIGGFAIGVVAGLAAGRRQREAEICAATEAGVEETIQAYDVLIERYRNRRS